VTALPENADDWLAGNSSERPSQQAAGNETEVILHETLKQLPLRTGDHPTAVFEEKEFAEIATVAGKRRERLCESN